MTDDCRETFEKKFKTLDFTKTRDAWDREIYAHSHIQAMFDGWQACWNARTPPAGDAQDLNQLRVCYDQMLSTIKAHMAVYPETWMETMKNQIQKWHDVFRNAALFALKPESEAQETLTIKDYEDVLADHRRLVRELDVILNGEDGAAKQASLCDIVAQAKHSPHTLGRFVLKQAALSAPKDISALIAEVMNGLLGKMRQKKGFYSVSVGHSEVKQAHKSGILKGLDAAEKEIEQAREKLTAALKDKGV